MPKPPPSPDFRADDQRKADIVGSFVPAVLDALDADGAGPTADDFLDTMAIGIAAMLEHDDHISTAQHERLAIETVTALIKRRLRQLRADRPERGMSLLAYILAQRGAEESTH